MKKIYRTIFIVLVFVNVGLSQTEKGTWLLGGNVSYSRSSGVGQLFINPTAAYFLVDHVAGGAQMSFISTKGGSSFSLGPFGKYYFYGNEKGRWYGTVGLNIGAATGTKFDTGFLLGAGYAIFLNQSISIDIGTLYNKVGSSGSIFTFGAGFQIHFSSLRN